MSNMGWKRIAAAAVATLCAGACEAQDFYRGKAISLLVGAPAGSEHDQLGKLIARSLPAHLPGKPTLTLDFRAGNSGVDALNAFSADAPKDGTALHLLMPGVVMLQAIGAPGVQYDANRLAFVGNLSHAPQTLATWWVTGFKTIDDARRREMLLGAVGKTSPGALLPLILNNVLRTRFKVAANFRKDSEVDEAMENTEIGGRVVSFSSLKSAQPSWILQKRVNLIAQAGITRRPELADVLLLWELAGNERDRNFLRFVSADALHARAIAAPPGTLPERLGELRLAFDAMVKDAGFIAEAARLDLSPDNGEVTQKVVSDELGARGEAERLRAIVAEAF